MNNPYISINFYGINHSTSITTMLYTISKTPAPNPFNGLAISALAPSAAIVNASSRKLEKVFCCGLYP